VDRVACVVAQRGVAQQIQNSADLSRRPDVKVTGFPFLTQALAGRYTKINGTVDDISVQDGVTIDKLAVRLSGVHVKLSDLAAHSVSSAPVDSAAATATVGYASMNRVAKANLSAPGLDVLFGPGQNGLISVTGAFDGVQIKGAARVLIQKGDLLVKLVPSSLDQLPQAIRSQVAPLLGGSYHLPSLPFGFKAETVTVGSDGVTVHASAQSVNLGS
jgi:hypothetical protein